MSESGHLEGEQGQTATLGVDIDVRLGVCTGIQLRGSAEPQPRKCVRALSGPIEFVCRGVSFCSHF